MKEIMLVCATRMSREAFKKSAPLSTSIKKLHTSAKKVTSKIIYQNRQGLGTIYNRYLKARHADKILVFVHDDVRIEDLFLVEKLNEALKTFDVVGLAGNKEPDPSYLSWFDQRRPLTGFVTHVAGKPTALQRETVFISSYGPTPEGAACSMAYSSRSIQKASSLVKLSLMSSLSFIFMIWIFA